jgi:NAD(P)-dependent dehydrogenase (short-subunit alcohol dehydrogenase family)
VQAVNLRGVFLGMRYGIPAMLAGGGGSVINVASIAGLVAFAGSTAYAASKAGVLAMTRVAAAEYGPTGVRVNGICPGVIETPMLTGLASAAPAVHAQIVAHAESMAAMKRLGCTGVAALAVFLASPESSFITGATIPVDGGYTAL